MRKFQIIGDAILLLTAAVIWYYSSNTITLLASAVGAFTAVFLLVGSLYHRS